MKRLHEEIEMSSFNCAVPAVIELSCVSPETLSLQTTKLTIEEIRKLRKQLNRMNKAVQQACKEMAEL